MERTIFYAPDIALLAVLPPDESLHCVRVLRMKEGDEILITDGKGTFYDAVIGHAHQKKCAVEIVKQVEAPKSWQATIHIAFAPTKNNDRTEWFAEKATEIGIDQLTPLICFHSERRELKLARIHKILVSAMKQSQKAHLPLLSEVQTFSWFVKQPFEGRKFIAHCYPQQKETLKNTYLQGENALVLIGPEGDFSEDEVALALHHGFEPISLGDSRLRTETAALVACHTLHVLNL